MLRRSFVNNVFFAFIAQSISILLSLFLSLVIPKFLPLEAFSFWQLFLFYSSYVGFAHLGLIDGIYLRLGGLSIDKVNKKDISGQFIFLFFTLFFFLILLFFLVAFDFINTERNVVIFYLAIYLLIHNIFSFLGYIMQAVNLTSVYSKAVILDKFLLLNLLVIYFFFFQCRYEYLCFFFCLSRLCSLLYCLHMSRGIFVYKKLYFRNILEEAIINIKTGLPLLISNISGALILGVSRMTIDKYWGLSTFGKISFSLSITMFLLAFISQISMVLFPTLRTLSIAKLKSYFVTIGNFIDCVFPFFVLVYFPLVLVVRHFLPQYNSCIIYFPYMIPICFFDGKMNLLFSTYMKVFRLERFLLRINILSLSFCFVLCFFSANYFNDERFVLLSSLLAIIARSVLVHEYLVKKINVPRCSNNVLEIVYWLLSIFILSYFSFNYSIIFIFILLVCYLSIEHKKVKNVANFLKKRTNF